MFTGSSGIVNEALRDLDRNSLAWPEDLQHVSRSPTSRDNLCAAYLRAAAGRDLLTERLVQTMDHALIVVRHGDLVIESAQSPFTVRQGDSAIVPPGWWRLTEVPAADAPISYWIIFFSPGLIQTVFGKNEAFRQAAETVAPAFSGVYIQRGLTRALRFYGSEEPVPDVEKTFRAIGALAGAGLFMFLKKHYFAPRDALERLVRSSVDSRCPVEQIGMGWPGGARSFRREFKLYHGASLHAWTLARKRGIERVGRVLPLSSHQSS